ncbi:hypothetical protein [Actinoplanes utahensis]|uniref:Uncharacterized protein n=1 Tax=Actinoplanes utahensis TaxID=1869 RepID=A0A0A6UFV6_ACTUT|nr:hypothetical protein [Actinoplanes utahensis]KHD73973.1 hypothetical protein MB27_31520 [Actinoplanes utahensis]GIF35646.1 hypothetical protein Aut01nite_86320 [Actinoplanes utahensis]
MTMSRKHFSRRLRRVGLLVGLAGIAVSTAGAAYAAPEPTEPAGATGATAAQVTSFAVETPADRAGYQAVSVAVERTRGRYETSLFQVSGNGQATGEVLRLASSPAFRALRPRYVPPNRSGRYRYEVTAHYRNGKTKRVVTYSGTAGTPGILLDVIRKVETLPTPTFPPGFPFTGGFPFS